ncbi:eight-cysteine-cluster domain-containing protein [Candidatus Woesearchaeota archaeon]|nr:eight-cysteine-cluster domain-containing protein [Candidatus Woesearchaeota archaeon]
MTGFHLFFLILVSLFVVSGCQTLNCDQGPEQDKCCATKMSNVECVGHWFMDLETKECACDETNPPDGFCGSSGLESCDKDDDCVKSGCSGQICMSTEKAGQILSTCEYKECYNAANYDLTCGCYEGKCAWHKVVI